MHTRKILFVFRKPHKGNYSIEKVYGIVIDELQKNSRSDFTITKKVLDRTMDLSAFIGCFFSSLFKKKFIVHVTGSCNYMILAFPFKTRVLTIHDMFHYNKIGGIKGKLYDLLFAHLPMYFSHKIVVVSENTKRTILEHIKIDPDKIKVIHNPLVISSEHIKKRTRLFSKDIPLKILQIGSKPLKNFARLVRATKELNVHYNFVHADPKQILELIEQEEIEAKSTVHCEINDRELFEQYAFNDVLFFASEAEGFGLPIIEAQAFGMPVITSNFPPMSEVGKGAILVDPFNDSSIRAGFEKLYDSTGIEVLTAEADTNVHQYFPKQIGEKYLNFYKGLA